MVVLLCIIICLLCVLAFFAVKVYLLRRSAREIAAGLSARISTDTNTLIGISSRDRAMRALAGSAAACSRATASCARL